VTEPLAEQQDRADSGAARRQAHRRGGGDCTGSNAVDLGDALRAGVKGVRKRAEASDSLRLILSSVA